MDLLWIPDETNRKESPSSQELLNSMPDPIQRARQFVQSAFSTLGSPDAIEETVLIRDGLYCGHQFLSGKLSAVWFFEESEVKIFGPNRQLLSVQSLEPTADTYRRAA